jgi:hypothetical protein
VGGTASINLTPGSWAKYANIDFGRGVRRAVFEAQDAASDRGPDKRYVHRSGDTIVEALPFKADQSVETVLQWEISKPFTKPGKTGPELFDEAFPPETDPGRGVAVVSPAADLPRGPDAPDAGTVDFDLVFGEENRHAAAYARAAIHAPTGRTNASMSITATGGFKVWFNGELIMAKNEPGTHRIDSGVIREGWNTVLVKVNQGADPGGFAFSFGTVASSCGRIVALPGRPDAAQESGVVEEAIIELRLDSPEGPVVGRLTPGQTACEVTGAKGVRDLYLVFPGSAVKNVDWFRFE